MQFIAEKFSGPAQKLLTLRGHWEEADGRSSPAFLLMRAADRLIVG